jgi:hypothetical protein
MGAQLWHHAGPWRDDPAESLLEIHRRVLQKYDLPDLLRKDLDSAREALRLTEQDDPYGLLDYYRGEVARLERLAALPPPLSLRETIDRLRALFSTSGEGIGSILDVTHVSQRGGMHVARQLAEDEIQRYCGTTHPTRRQAVAAVSPINTELERGESVCFPYYNEKAIPLGWYFVGNTID